MEGSPQLKKSKKKKQESDIESVVCLNDHPKKKKKIKVSKEVNHEDDIMEQAGMSSSPKKGTQYIPSTWPVKNSKKRKSESDIESVICVNDLPKKKKKQKVPKEVLEEVNDEPEEKEQEVDEVLSSPRNCYGEEDLSWSKEDYYELLSRIEAQLPKNDTASFNTRIEKLDWNKIQFGNHSINECYEVWKTMRGKVRHYRLLAEVVQDLKSWVENPWKATGKKKPRHPEQPTRPLSSFILFFMDKRNKIMKRNPGAKLTEISRLVGEKYKALSDDKRSFYIEKAKLMQEEYKQNLTKFHEKYPELMKMIKESKKNELKAGMKRPVHPMKLYIDDKLEKHKDDENFNKNDLREKYKYTWKNSLSNKKKAYWIRIAQEDEEKYLAVLREKENGEARRLYKSVISKEELAILDRLAGKPEKPPRSAYALFSRLMLQDKDHYHVEGEPKNRMKEIALKWKELPEDKKHVYTERVHHMNETYKLEMANYLESLPDEKKAEELAKLQSIKKRKPKKSSSGVQSNGLFKNEPPKPPATAWDLYKTEYAKKNRTLPTKIATKHAADLWKSLPPKQTEKYNMKFTTLKEKYLVDFENFLKSLNEEELKDYSMWKNAQNASEEVDEESGEDESLSEHETEDGSASSSSSDDDSGVSDK